MPSRREVSIAFQSNKGVAEYVALAAGVELKSENTKVPSGLEV